MTDNIDNTRVTPGSSSGPHLYYRRPGLLARLRTAWMADYDADYRQGYHDGYEHTDEEDPRWN